MELEQSPFPNIPMELPRIDIFEHYEGVTQEAEETEQDPEKAAKAAESNAGIVLGELPTKNCPLKVECKAVDVDQDSYNNGLMDQTVKKPMED